MAHLGALQSYIVTTPPSQTFDGFLHLHFPLLEKFHSWKRAEYFDLYFALMAIV